MTLPTTPTFNELPGNTIVPSLQEEVIFIQYFNRLYEDIAFAVNNKDNIAFDLTISNNPVDIPNLPPFGSVFLIVSGIQNSQPCGIWALARSKTSIAGNRSEIVTQDGTDAWATFGILITVEAVTKNFQIQHDRPNFTANFKIRILQAI